MDILHFLNSRLDFVQRFYDTAAKPFEETIRQIKLGEDPFLPRRQPEDYDGPEYQIEWTDADDSLRVLGQCCLVLIQKALQDYLREFIMREADIARSADLPAILNHYRVRNTGWFERYCAFLSAKTGFDWNCSPVERTRIEQINLCRIDILHEPDIESTRPRQSEDHYHKYPVSLFADELEMAVLTGGKGKPEFALTINVTRERLTATIKDVGQFCGFVETQRTRW